MWLETLSKPENDACKCPTCGGGIQRRAYGEMYAGSYVLNGERMEIRRIPNEGFVDPIYLDSITQYFNGGLYRMWPSERYLSRGGKRIHRDVWKVAFGEIPKGCHIHHKDGNILNNILSNLECIDAKEHSVHADHKPGNRTFSDEARSKAAEWHRSDEGRLWHKRHAERSKSWTKQKRVTKLCKNCNKEFEGLERKNGNEQIYCSNPCKVMSYRDKHRQWAKDYRERQKAKLHE